MRRTRSPRTRRGFTLVELMISVTILLIAIGIAIPFFLVQSRALAAQSGRLDAQLNINFGLDAIERDLRVAGAGVTNRQPLLVQAAADAITFNADLTGSSALDFAAVYYDPDAPPLTIGLLWPQNAIVLPNSSWSYPDSAYWQSAGVPSAAETISYWVEPDSQTNGLFRLMRRVNDAPPRVLARGIRTVPGEPFFRYFSLGATGQLVEVPAGALPMRHVPGGHGSLVDTANLALVDSVRLVRLRFTAVHRDPRYADVTRTEERVVRIMNAGLILASTCGEPPLAPGFPTATASTTPSVTLQWSASTDDGAGEKDVERYAIYRRAASDPAFGEPLASIAAGQAPYAFTDTDVKPGDAWVYGIAAQDCTPATSPVMVAPTVVVP